MFKINDWISRDSKVLDLGCGDGSLLSDLRKEKSASALGIEIDAEKIKSCLEKGISVIEQDIDNGLENFGNQSFDYVVMSQSIQALKKPEVALEEIVRIGKECIVSIPNFANIKCRLQLFFKGQMPVSNALPHDWYSTPNLHLCSLEDFEELCKKSNIKIVERKLSKINGEESILMKLLPNLFSEVALYKLVKEN
jgi:methionine biosynthesis protein MetW